MLAYHIAVLGSEYTVDVQIAGFDSVELQHLT